MFRAAQVFRRLGVLLALVAVPTASALPSPIRNVFQLTALEDILLAGRLGSRSLDTTIAETCLSYFAPSAELEPRAPARSLVGRIAARLDPQADTLLAEIERLPTSPWKTAMENAVRALKQRTPRMTLDLLDLLDLNALLAEEPLPDAFQGVLRSLTALLVPYLAGDVVESESIRELLALTKPTDPILRRVLVLSTVLNVPEPNIEERLSTWRQAVQLTGGGARRFTWALLRSAEDPAVQKAVIENGLARNHELAPPYDLRYVFAAMNVLDQAVMTILEQPPQTPTQWVEVHWAFLEIVRQQTTRPPPTNFRAALQRLQRWFDTQPAADPMEWEYPIRNTVEAAIGLYLRRVASPE